jgi:hypothetical protein
LTTYVCAIQPGEYVLAAYSGGYKNHHAAIVISANITRSLSDNQLRTNHRAKKPGRGGHTKIDELVSGKSGW